MISNAFNNVMTCKHTNAEILKLNLKKEKKMHRLIITSVSIHYGIVLNFAMSPL